MARTSAGGIQEIEIQNATHTFAVDAEAGDAYAITLTPAVTAYTTGQRFAFKANTANTGAASLNVNGLGAKTIKKHLTSDLASNDIKSGSIVEVSYDGTNFQMVSMLAQAPAGSGDMTIATYDPLGVSGQLAGTGYANSFTKSQAIKSDSDAMSLAVRRNGAAQTAKIMEIQTEVNGTLASFDKDGKLAVPEVTIDASGNLNFGAVTVIDDNAGTTTLQNIDAIDATTETTLEAALDFGNVSKVGTPVDNQVGVWTGDGTIEGDSGFTFDGGLNVTVANNENKVGLTINQNDVTNNPVGVSIVKAGLGYNLSLQSTQAVNSGAGLEMYHNSASPATSDNSYIEFYANNSAAEKVFQGAVFGVWNNLTDGSEEGALNFWATSGGLEYNGGIGVTTDSAGSGKLYSLGNQNLILQTGNATTGNVTIVDGANGDVQINTNGSGKLDVNATIDVSGNIELGHATDTTLSRVSAGVVAVEGKNIALNGTSETLTTGTIELGAASDTTIARSGAGTVTIEGNQILTVAGGTMTGNITLGENTSIALDPAGSADGKYSGITVTGTAGADLAFGDLIYLDPTDSRWELADANSASGADGDARGLLGICVNDPSGDGQSVTVLLNGIVRADTAFPTFTVNNPIYVSETAGDVTQTQPTTTDVVIRIIGSALTTDEMYFNPDWAWITHT